MLWYLYTLLIDILLHWGFSGTHTYRRTWLDRYKKLICTVGVSFFFPYISIC
jgi:hypothetical protein